MTDHGLDLAVIGNGRTAALVDPTARLVWWCYPRFDRDPIFCRLLSGDEEKGFCDVVLDNMADYQSEYLRNTAVVSTVLTDRNGGSVRITDFAPRLPAPATHPHDRTGGRAAAHHPSFPPDARLRTGVHPSFRRQQSYPLHPRVDRHPPHHRCAAVLHRERSTLRAHAAASSRLRGRRALSRRTRNHLPRILRPHHRLLDGLVAGSLHFLRLAG